MLNSHKSIILKIKKIKFTIKNVDFIDLLKLTNNLGHNFIIYNYYYLYLSSNNINELEKMRY